MLDGRTFVTRFTSDTSSYTKGISEMQAKLKGLNKDLKDNQAEQKAAAKTIKDAEKEITKLTKQIEKNGDEDGKLTKQIEELNHTINTERDHIEKLKIAQSQIQRQINETNDSIAKQKKALDTLAKSYDDSKKYAKELAAEIGGLAASGSAALAVLFKLAEGAAAWADDLETMSQKTGIAVTELQKFQYASELIDVSAETVAGALNRMTLNMQSAKNSAGTQREAFEALGVSYEDATGKLRDRETVFYELIDALGQVKSETERDALAMNIFGRSATELNPLIKGGAQTLKELGAQAEAAGLILSDETVKGLHNFNDEIDLLKAKGSQIGHILAGQTTPAFEGMLSVADSLLDKVNELAQSGELEKMARQAGVYITDLAEKLEKLIGWCWQYKEAIAAGTAALVSFKIAMSIGNLVTALIAGFKALSVATKAETADMAALNVVMDANPIGLVLGLVGALIGLFGTLAITTGQVTSALDELNQTLDRAEDSASRTIARAEAGISTINSLASEYDRLRGQSSLNEYEQRKLASIAEQLRSKLGLQSDQVKTASGAYQDLSKYIEEASEKMRAQAKLSAAQSVLETAYEEMYKGERALADAQKAYNQFVEENKEFVDRYRRGENTIWENDKATALMNLSKAVNDANQMYAKASEAVGEYENNLVDATAEMKTFGESAEDTGNTIENDLNNSYKQDTKNFTVELWNKYSSQKDVYQKMLEQNKGLVDKYKENYGIDLRNFANAEDARLTIVAKAQEKFEKMRDAYNKYDSGNYQIGMDNGKEYLLYKDKDGEWQRAAEGSAEYKNWQKSKSDYLSAMAEASNAGFDFQRIIDDALGSFISSGGLENTGSTSKGSTSKGSTSKGSTSGKNNGFRVWDKDAEGTGESYASAYLDWINKKKALGKMSLDSEIKRLKELRDRTDLSADERYKIELALYNATNKLAQEQDAENKSRAEQAAEAYKALVQGKIDSQKKLADEAKKTADKEIAAIDAVMKKRQEEQDDEKRRKEIKSIDDQLKYKQLDDISRYELRKRRQELLTEQAEADYTRSMEAKKANISARAEAFQVNSDAAIARLNAAIDKGTYAIAKQAGTLTTSQIINHNSTTQNMTVMQNNLSDSQLIEKLKKMLYSG